MLDSVFREVIATKTDRYGLAEKVPVALQPFMTKLEEFRRAWNSSESLRADSEVDRTYRSLRHENDILASACKVSHQQLVDLTRIIQQVGVTREPVKRERWEFNPENLLKGDPSPVGILERLTAKERIQDEQVQKHKTELASVLASYEQLKKDGTLEASIPAENSESAKFHIIRFELTLDLLKRNIDKMGELILRQRTGIRPLLNAELKEHGPQLSCYSDQSEALRAISYILKKVVPETAVEPPASTNGTRGAN
jgi:hypothetical protein